VAGTIVSMSLSLIAVFIPILLMGGVVGRLFHEFGLVVSLAIAISAIVSLTVTPMMAAKLPRSSVKPPAPLSPPGLFDVVFQRVLRGYDRSVAWCLAHPVLIVLAFVCTIATSGVLYGQIPSTFLPQEDIGQLQINVRARQDISYPLMAILEQSAAAAVRASPSVDHVTSTVANDTLNTGEMFVQLKPKNARPPLPQVMSQLRAALTNVPGITSTMKPIQSLRISGGGSGSYQMVVQSLDPTILPLWSAKIAQAMAADPQTFIEVTPDPQNTALQLNIVINRDAAAALGVSANAIRAAIQSGYGSQTVSTLQTAGNTTNIYLEFDTTLPGADQLLSTITVRSNSGVSVPLSSVASLTTINGPVFVNQTGQLVSTNISFNLPNGVGLSNAISQIAQIKQNIGLPSNVFTMYSGTAALFTQTMASQATLIIAAILTIYIVLGVLYESFIHPITILSGLPAASTGALLALMITGHQLSVIAIIGIFMLIGIVKKNAIMMVDVALSLKRTEGLAATEAIRVAAVRRFRPIMMTTLCAIFGALPIALGTGPSSELRQPLGIAVVGGLLLSQVLTLFITPVIFVQLDRLSDVATSIRNRFAWKTLLLPRSGR
jgi:HAE1 family hydrophobic/amphiphilic exporter-1